MGLPEQLAIDGVSWGVNRGLRFNGVNFVS